MNRAREETRHESIASEGRYNIIVIQRAATVKERA